MANPDHLSKLKGGEWNGWRKGHFAVIPDLSRANLRDADLRRADLRLADLGRADLRRANLRGADLRRADLRRTNLRGADLREADLGRADLRRANFLGTNLRGADLREVDLRRANLGLADLRLADLRGADLREADLGGADLSGADFGRADLRRANLSGVNLIQTTLEGANLTAARVYGISAWDVKIHGASQTNLVITPIDQPDITVDGLEIAQFVYLLLTRSKLREVIITIGEKAVLILGRFTERKELLDFIANKLRDLDYLPIIFDFDRPTDHDLTDTVRVLAGLSRFVIADITNPPSVSLELQAAVPDYMVPFVTILQRGQPTFRMFDDLPRKYHWALPLLEYNNAETLLAAFETQVIAPALEKLEEVRQQKGRLPARRSATGS